MRRITGTQRTLENEKPRLGGLGGPGLQGPYKASMLRMATDYDKLAARAIARGAKGASGGL
jgi:hypothetical protein